ncbi:uncharacterized protein Gasu_26470 [Galdieria sulphuraria]|uniref:Transmembrane protein n=1 Tax=Galdieria sulphuraria TaxID=130081 RepID=M2XIY1_GALSU|nr:uncharacterized protein Gasu_26470 [Galdieria sulphuraria]EME30062.1 hypothetical protein Gasu_26470 [Galdieria sulphuraria]|eukprot:XP_005706582.1 hypothetical protein Gasu_26470 [Galdieria sulphuraria]
MPRNGSLSKRKTNSSQGPLRHLFWSLSRSRIGAGAGLCAGVGVGNCATIGGLFFPPVFHVGVSAGTGICLGYGVGVGFDFSLGSLFSWLDSLLR